MDTSARAVQRAPECRTVERSRGTDTAAGPRAPPSVRVVIPVLTWDDRMNGRMKDYG
jgi:hypothetical protein